MSVRAAAPAAAILVLLVAGCAAGPGTDGRAGPPETAAATQMQSLSPAVASTVAALQAKLSAAGYRLDPADRVYRPAEPAELVGAPRAVLQADVGDDDGGLVVVYEFSEPSVAASRAQLFARFLESGFGQTNYPIDAQFALRQLGSTLVFTWWSRERAADPDRAQGAFDLLSSLGIPIDIRK